MENHEQNLPQQEQPFVAAKQVSFDLEDIILNINNEVALLYQEHTNKGYFNYVFDFISECCLRKPFIKSPNMYQEYLAEFWYSTKALENSNVSFLVPTGGIYGKVGLNTFRNAIGAHYLPYSSEYVAPPSIDVIKKWFPMIEYGEEVSTKGTLRNSLRPPRWRNKKPATSSKQPSMSGKEATNGGSSKAPTSIDPHVLVDQTKSVSEGLETVLTQPTTEKGASSTTIHYDKEKASPGIHGDKEEASSIIKLEDLAKLVSQIQPSFKDLDSPEDDHFIIVDKSDKDEPNAETKDTSSQKHKLELEKNKVEAEAAILNAQLSFPNVEHLNELLWKLPKEFLSLPAKVELAQAKLKTLDALPSLLLNVTKALHKFKEDSLDKLNDLTNKKRKHVDDIHDYFKATKRLKSSVEYRHHLPGTVLNELVLDDHARTFSSLLLAEVEKKLNPFKQMRTIEQLRQ
nr:hypothetical protein [Tanacetum cinerariifolium]